jgi:hypothetical protein
LLFSLAIALFAYIMVYERPQPVDESVYDARRLMPDVTPTAVNRVELTSTNQPVAAELRDHRWQLVSPVPYPANEIAIRSLLNACSALESKLTVKADDISRLSDFGLDPPRATLTVYQGSSEIKLHIGAVTPLNNQLYVRPAGADDIAVVDASFTNLLPVSSALWRSPYLLDLANTDFNRIQIRNNNSIIVLENGTNNRWRIVQPPPPKRADSERIGQLIEYWKQWLVKGFTSDNRGTPLDALGLDKPEYELSFAKGTNQLLSVQFGGTPANMTNAIFARLPMSGNIVVAEAHRMAPLQRNYWAFCDHRMIDPLTDADFDIVEVSGAENFRLQRRTNGLWRADNKQQTPIDPALMYNFLELLKGTEAAELAKEVVTDYAEYGLAKPSQSYRLYRATTNDAGQATNTLVAGIDFGKSGVDRTFARRHDENAVYVIPRARLELLPKALYQIRSRILWSFVKENILSVSVFNDVKTNRLTRSPTGKWSLQENRQAASAPLDVLENAATEEGIVRLGLLKSESWISRGTNSFGPYQIGPRRGGLNFELKQPAGRRHTLLFGRWPQNRNVYAAYRDPSDGQWVVFEFPAALYENFILPYFSIKDE